ncbi:MAG: YdbH domain-containing protein [Alphaproteobacteria bacterium]
MTRRVLRFCRQVLLALLILLVLIGAAAWLWRLPLAERAAAMLAAAQGVSLDLTVTALELDHAAAEAIRIGTDRPIAIAAARVDYQLPQVLRGIVDRVSLDGLNAAIVIDNDGLRIPALANLDDAASSETAPLPPLPPIHLTKARLSVDTAQGTVEAAGNATLAAGTNGQTIEAQLAAGLGGNRLEGALTATRGVDGRLSGRLRLDGGALAQGDIAATLAKGEAIFEWDPASEPLPRGTADLALPGLRLRDVSLGETTLRLVSDGQSATADLVTATDAQRLVAHLDLQDAAGPAPTAALTAALELDGFAPFADLPGRGRVEVDGFAALPPLTELTGISDLPVEATVRIELADLTFPPLADGSATAALHARTTASGTVDVTLLEPAMLAGTLPEPIDVTLHLTEGPLARIDLATQRAAGTLNATVSVVPGTVALKSDYALVPEGEHWRLDLPEATASADSMDLPDMKLAGLDVMASDIAIRLGGAIAVTAPTVMLRAGRWRAQGYTGSARADASDLAWSPDGYGGKVRIGLDVQDTAKLDAALSISGRDETVEARLDDCATVTLPKLQLGDNTIAGGPARACPRGDLPLLRRDGDIAVNARLRPSQWRVETSASPVSVELAALDLAGRLVGKTWSARVSGSGHRVVADDLRIAAEDIALDASFAGDAGKAKLDIARIVDRQPAPRFAPLRLAANATLAANAVATEGTITDPKDRATIVFAAKHDLDTGKGDARLASEPPLAFAKDGLQPTQLLPLLRGLVTSVEGLLDIRAKAAWGGDELTSEATVEATAIGAQTPLAVLEGLNGKVAFTSLVPPQTAPRQTITLARLDIGLPLIDGEAEITLRPDGKLDLHKLGWPWAGGRIHLADEVIDPLADTIAATLRVDDVDLAELARLLENENVDITGRIGGTIPVEIKGDSVFIRDARLASIDGGTIRYVSQGAEAIMDKGGAGSELLIQALKDFRYDKLIATLNGETTGNLDLALQLRGANPELYDGYPFELNFAVGGALVEMLRQGLAGYRIPDNIVRELRGEPKQ